MPVLTGSPCEASNHDPDTLFFPRLDQTLGQAYDVGLTRLRAPERQLLFQVDAGFIRAIQPRDCSSLVSGRMTDERWGKLFDGYQVQLSPLVLRGYYSATRRAMGLGQGAQPRTLNAQEIRRVEEAILPAIDTMISKQKNPRAMYDA
ncbi:MAG: hypothetical protein AAFV31_17070 [Pseudomonadota bacterium]